MMSEDAPLDPADGYVLVRDLIFDQVHKFRRRYGGDFEELVGTANLAFVEGHHRFVGGVRPSGKPYCTTYATEIRRWVWYTMFDTMRAERYTQKRHVVTVPIDDLEIGQFSYEFDVRDWASGLGEDARYVVELLLYPPEDVEAMIMDKGGEPRNFRSTVRAYLTSVGWTAERVGSVFAEIKRALR